jgi:hypothetical protein
MALTLAFIGMVILGFAVILLAGVRYYLKNMKESLVLELSNRPPQVSHEAPQTSAKLETVFFVKDSETGQRRESLKTFKTTKLLSEMEREKAHREEGDEESTRKGSYQSVESLETF